MSKLYIGYFKYYFFLFKETNINTRRKNIYIR